MGNRSLLESLRERRVIRTALLYIALLWVALQAADLLASADIIPEQAVRWLILLGAVGLPVTILVSWFFDAPWKKRRWTSVGGDIVILVAVALAAFLFAWQQWFTSFTRPTIAVLKIESTDLRDDSEQLGAHLSLRLRTALATRPEIRVIEPASAFHEKMDGLSMADKAALVGADYVIAGTIAQLDSRVRVNVQLFNRDGELAQSAIAEESFMDQAELQGHILTDIWPNLPLPEGSLHDSREAIRRCAYPEDREAILTIARVDGGDLSVDTSVMADAHRDSGMLQLASAKQIFRQMADANASRKPVMQQVAMQHLDNARRLCPQTPDWAFLRLANTKELISDELLHEHPNSALVNARAARQDSHADRAEALLKEAKLLDPLGDW